MVALNIFVMMDGAIIRRYIPNPIMFLVGILIPIIGHSKSVTYVSFALIAKAGLAFLTYGITKRLTTINDYELISFLMILLALVDAFFYAYLFLPRYAEFWNWRDGRFIVSDFKWF